jgi:hypothetical protein
MRAAFCITANCHCSCRLWVKSRHRPFKPTNLTVTAERRNAHREIAISALAWPNGDDVMHFADYLVLGLLIACMLGAASVILSRRDS